MITNHQHLLVSLEQLQELELALASIKREVSSPTAFIIQATSIQKEVCRIRHEIDVYLGVPNFHIAAAVENAARESKLDSQSPLFSFVAGSQQDPHIHEDRNTENV
jgi:hypothetical protein